MDTSLYWFARALVALLQALPLTWVARFGRAGGMLAYWLDARHRRVALRNLTMCFGAEKSPAEILALARENYRRLGENYACGVKTAGMTFAELQLYVKCVGAEKLRPPLPDGGLRSRVIAYGHFGNFELFARLGQFAPGYQCACTYRALKQPKLDRLFQSLRAGSGCLYFERRTEGEKLKALLRRPGVALGFASDQSSGPDGLRLPFLGHDCSTTSAPAVFALRYDSPLHPTICYRTGLARWTIEVGDEVPIRENGKRRSAEAVMRDVNRALEAAVRRDPANWFWVHNRWKEGAAKAGMGDGG